MNRKLTSVWLFLGLASRLQLVASLSITELVVLISAPFIFIKTHNEMKRDGVMPLFVMSLLVILGCIIASVANKTELFAVIRGMAVTCLVSCSIIVSHFLLHRDPGGFKWFLVGSAISMTLSAFVFKQTVEVTMLGESTEDIMAGPIFWIKRLGAFISLPTVGWYLKMPWLLNITAPLFMAIFSISTSVSGRSATLGAVAFVALVIIGGKTRMSMARISRHFVIILFLGLIGAMSMYILYKTAASQNWLGDEARVKYERQTQGGQGGIGRLILGGRGESFIGLLACRDKPIVGWGPWAIDENGYVEEFINRFGTYEDVIDLQRSRMTAARFGITLPVGLIPFHSQVVHFWLWYGVFGLLFWIYVIFILLRYLKQDVNVVPQWFAWLACSTPKIFWGIFFGAFADRFDIPLFIVACLMARAIRLGRFQLPYDMVKEIIEVEKKG